MVPLQDKPIEGLSEDEKRVLRIGERAKNQMITANLRLVVNLAKRYQARDLNCLI